MVTNNALSLGVMQLEYDADCWPPSSAEAKNAWSYTTTSSYIFTAQCLIKQVQLYFYLRLLQFHIICVMFMFGLVSINIKKKELLGFWTFSIVQCSRD
jgi:hypothetical protein